MNESRFELRADLRTDPRFVRREAFDRQLQCSVMLQQPGVALLAEIKTQHGVGVLKEARMLASITHPNVVRLREVTELDGVPTLVLDLPTGQMLDDLLAAEGRLPSGQVARIGRDLAQAAQAVHAEGVVHRGISAENVFLEPGSGRAMLAGFTFAKLLDKRMGNTSLDHRKREKAEAAALGLPTYSAPEQLGGRPADHRADVFALGCLLYRCLTGREAFPSESVDLGRPEPPHKFAPGTSRALGGVVMRCLALAPSQRFQNMVQLDEALAALQAQGEPSRRGWVLGVGVGAAAVLAAFVVPQIVDGIMGRTQYGRAIYPTPEDLEDYDLRPVFTASRALVIGIDYKGSVGGLPPLQHSKSDAVRVATRLEELGWAVTPLYNEQATEVAILEHLHELTRGERDDRVLVYLAGHGALHPTGDRTFHFLAHDASQAPSTAGWISPDELLPYVRGPANPKHVLLVLDCCHAGAITRSAMGIEDEDDVARNYIEAVARTQPSRWVMTSSRGSELADDDSLFCAGFLRALANVTPERPATVYSIQAEVSQLLLEHEATQVAALKCYSDHDVEYAIGPVK